MCLHSPLQFSPFYSILKLRLILILKLLLHKNETKTRFLLYGKVITMSSFYCNYAATVFRIYCYSSYLYRRSKKKQNTQKKKKNSLTIHLIFRSTFKFFFRTMTILRRIQNTKFTKKTTKCLFFAISSRRLIIEVFQFPFIFLTTLSLLSTTRRLF